MNPPVPSPPASGSRRTEFLIVGSAVLIAVVAALLAQFGGIPKAQSIVGLVVILGIAYALSNNRRAIDVRTVAWGLGLQIVFAILVLKTSAGQVVFTTLGRYIYAVGGNAEAARLAGVRVHAVLLLVYTVCAILAGLGGVIMASQLKSGAPTYGLMYELYVIAAVVVGGTSLSGGEGRIFGTLIGAFIIAVIQNGMNLTNVESYTQKVVLGLVILGAVLLDRLKHRGWFWQRRRGRAADKET